MRNALINYKSASYNFVPTFREQISFVRETAKPPNRHVAVSDINEMVMTNFICG